MIRVKLENPILRSTYNRKPDPLQLFTGNIDCVVKLDTQNPLVWGK